MIRYCPQHNYNDQTSFRFTLENTPHTSLFRVSYGESLECYMKKNDRDISREHCIGYLSDTNRKPKYRGIPFAQDLLLSYPLFERLKFCIGFGIDTYVNCANF